MPWWYAPAPRRTREIKGGIKAHSKRGDFGESWWAKRWLETLEECNIGARLSRGKTYARAGRVVSLKTGSGFVKAVVHGSYKYDVVIAFTPIEEKKWKKVADKIFNRPAIAARLLAGQMPENIEDIFSELRLSLFPTIKDIAADCTCFDWANPCKHIAAVYLLLAEEFDRDPFLLFRLRGMEKQKLLSLAGLGTKSGRTKKSKPAKNAKQYPDLPVYEPEIFWARPSEIRHEINAAIPAVDAALVKQLGNFPFWRGGEEFIPSMEKIYKRASLLGVDVFLGRLFDDDT